MGVARQFYNLLFYLLTPVICLRLWWRGRRVPGYRQRWSERFGFMPAIPTQRPVIWVHSVSVGETIAAAPMIKLLQTAFPGHVIAVTTTTPTGSERVRAMLGDSVYHCYAPYDLPDAVARTLDRLHPQCLVIMETELWPNLVRQCHRRGVPVIVANARLSAKSARSYARFGSLTEPMLSQLSMVAAQHSDDGNRFVQLGLPTEKLAITGNIKFDLTLTPDQIQAAEQLRQEWRGEAQRPVWLAASTHQGEEEIVLTAFEGVHHSFPSALLVLVPRHPDRFDAIADLCEKRGFSLVRRSRGEAPDSDTDVLLGDTMGELQLMFGACDLAFVGGSLVPVGGHNLLEPAAWKKPVLSGPELFNFSQVSTLLLAANGLEICEDAEQLSRRVTALLEDGPRRKSLGEAAYTVVEANRGATHRLIEIIVRSMAK